jgi:hypothetical protein
MVLSSEFEKQIRKITDRTSSEKIVEIVNFAAQEFPCLSCNSKEECATFAWFTKWFGKQDSKP